jgi:hypothetical protein
MIEVALVLIFLGPSWVFAALYYYFGIRKHLASPEREILNANLAKVGLFWSDSDGTFKTLSDGAIEQDQARFLRSFLIMTGFLSLLSIVGMFLLILIFISGRPRLEHNTFKSILVNNRSLSTAEVEAQVADLKSRV